MAPTSFADPVDLGGSLRPAVPKPGDLAGLLHPEDGDEARGERLSARVFGECLAVWAAASGHAAKALSGCEENRRGVSAFQWQVSEEDYWDS